MTDHFAVLGFAVAPSLDAGAVHEAFHEQSARLHPDLPDGNAEAFRALNAAHACLRDPASRLRHLLELIDPTRIDRSNQPPPAALELFAPLGEALQKARSLNIRAGTAESPLAQALLTPEKLETVDALVDLLGSVESARGALLARIEALGGDWQNPEGLAGIGEIQRELMFYNRWASQLTEAIGNVGL